MSILHFDKVDTQNIEVGFTEDKYHRSSITIPFLDREGCKKLCIIGQNPSNANEYYADNTLLYLERFVFQNLPEYSKIVMLNLYSRIDTKKKEKKDLERSETIREFLFQVENNSDFLLVFGAKKKEGAYQFSDKSERLMKILSGKNVFKIDIGTNTNYPPHPGNPKILYRNYDYGISSFPQK